MVKVHYDVPDIPTFLLRGHPDCIVKPQSEAQIPTIEDTQSVVKEPVKVRLTAAHKSRVAQSVIAAVRNGNNTFGKIRKALPNYTDRELKSAIRYAKNWQQTVERFGSRRKPQHRFGQQRIEQDGRQYKVVRF
jgi:hypothetical protein